jgi:energy-coupling factor transporter ATP-binding protein EcfA2
MFKFIKAEKTQRKSRVAVQGAAGSGKTTAAQTLAEVLARGSGRVACIDTEHGSASLYAEKFDFDTLRLDPPYTPERYTEAIRAAESAGYAVLIIDSLSHAWAGSGGILEMVDSAKRDPRSGNRNALAPWADATPKHQHLIEAIMGAKMHIIATMRTKTEWALELNDKGKTVPRKIGLAPVQREGTDYEFDLVFEVGQDHTASTSKDRTGLFGSFIGPITETQAEQLAIWLTSGAPAQPKPAPTPDPEEEIRIAEKRHEAQRAAQAKADAKPATKGNGKPCCDIQTAVLDLFHQATSRGCALDYWKSTMSLMHYAHKDHDTHTPEIHRSIAEWTDKVFGEPPAEPSYLPGASSTGGPVSSESSSTGYAPSSESTSTGGGVA